MTDRQKAKRFNYFVLHAKRHFLKKKNKKSVSILRSNSPEEEVHRYQNDVSHSNVGPVSSSCENSQTSGLNVLLKMHGKRSGSGLYFGFSVCKVKAYSDKQAQRSLSCSFYPGHGFRCGDVRFFFLTSHQSGQGAEGKAVGLPRCHLWCLRH